MTVPRPLVIVLRRGGTPEIRRGGQSGESVSLITVSSRTRNGGLGWSQEAATGHGQVMVVGRTRVVLSARDFAVCHINGEVWNTRSLVSQGPLQRV